MIKNRYLYMTLLAVSILLLADPAFCGIQDVNIKAASKTFVGAIKDWVTPIMAAGLLGSGICLFVNNYRMGIAGLAGTGFLYAAKAFIGTGEAALISMAGQLLS